MTTQVPENLLATLGDKLEASHVQPDWKEHLMALQQTAMSVREQLSEHLTRRKQASIETPAADETRQELTTILESLSLRQDSLEEIINATWCAVESENSKSLQLQQSDAPPNWAFELQTIVSDRLAAVESRLESLSESMHSTSSDRVDTPEAEGTQFDFGWLQSPDASNVASIPISVEPECADWLSVMLGPTLSADPSLSSSILWIKENILEGEANALGLVGQLLVFRCANSDRKPSLLKDVGEALYRCFPKSISQGHPFENALAAWSRQQCEAAGLPNSIELVHPGERFDAARHSAVERGGVEVSEVLGWIVLRDGGRVYSKASVKTR